LSRRKVVAPMLELESTLVVVVPEAEALVGSFRDLYDPVAAAGVPAHITVLYPFKSPDEVNETVMGFIGSLAKSCIWPQSRLSHSVN
jgi:hypothetical protein